MKKIAIVQPSATTWAGKIGVADPQEVVFRLPYNFPVLLARLIVEQSDWEDMVVVVSQTAESPEEFAVLLMHAYQQYLAKIDNPLAVLQAQMMLEAVERGEFSDAEQRTLHAEAQREYRTQNQKLSTN